MFFLIKIQQFVWLGARVSIVFFSLLQIIPVLLWSNDLNHLKREQTNKCIFVLSAIALSSEKKNLTAINNYCKHYFSLRKCSFIQKSYLRKFRFEKVGNFLKYSHFNWHNVKRKHPMINSTTEHSTWIYFCVLSILLMVCVLTLRYIQIHWSQFFSLQKLKENVLFGYFAISATPVYSVKLMRDNGMDSAPGLKSSSLQSRIGHAKNDQTKFCNFSRTEHKLIFHTCVAYV